MYFKCETHNNVFKHVCIACLDDIFHVGFGIDVNQVKAVTPDYEWDDTNSFIESL